MSSRMSDSITRSKVRFKLTSIINYATMTLQDFSFNLCKMQKSKSSARQMPKIIIMLEIGINYGSQGDHICHIETFLVQTCRLLKKSQATLVYTISTHLFNLFDRPPAESTRRKPRGVKEWYVLVRLKIFPILTVCKRLKNIDDFALEVHDFCSC